MTERPLSERVEELRNKINLLEGERKAYYEKSYYSQKKNKERIVDLRNENKDLRKQVKDRMSADDHIIGQAFQDKPVERAALANKTGREAIQTVDFKVCDTKKRLNSLRHVSDIKQKKLDELQQENKAMEQDAEEAKATEAGESEEGQKLRKLENDKIKTDMKLKEAEKIRRTYERILSSLQEDYLTFGNTLDEMEKEIEDSTEEINHLTETNEEAQKSKDEAVQKLRQTEERVYSDRKRRESDLQKLKVLADEKKLQHEKMERRMALRDSTTDAGPERTSGSPVDNQQEKINDLKEAFECIKEATGVSDLDEVVLRFENQGAKKEQLEQMKRETELRIRRLQEDRNALKARCDEVKYSGQCKLSSGQKMLEHYQRQLQMEENSRDKIDTELKACSKVLVECKAGVDHLHEKLAHVKVPRTQAPQAVLDPSSDNFVLEVLSKCEERLQQLKDELNGVDIEKEETEMRKSEFSSKIETKLPQQNMRVNLLPRDKQRVYDDSDEDDDADDGGEVLSRQQVKKQSQQLIDQKTKKRVSRKKKKK